MTKQQAESLYALVNSSVWREYLSFKEERLNELHKDLEWQVDVAAVRTQGKIEEIRNDLALQKNINYFFENN